MKRIDELGISAMPWEVEGDFVWANDGFQVHAFPYTSDEDEPVQKRDSRLIASAPELYEVLRELVELHEQCDLGCDHCKFDANCEEVESDIVNRAKAALAKAVKESEAADA